MTTYFSQKEFAVMRAEITGMAAVRWMALSGKPLTATEAKKLDETLEDFFRATGHRAFRDHGREEMELREPRYSITNQRRKNVQPSPEI